MRSCTFALVVTFFALPATTDAQELSGHWSSGHWVDNKSGHTGPLKADFHCCGPDAYRVTFTGRFWKVFPFRYTVTLTVTGRSGDRVFLTGEQHIPIFGTFHYQAEGTACEFTCHFCSRRYDGDFVLRR